MFPHNASQKDATEQLQTTQTTQHNRSNFKLCAFLDSKFMFWLQEDSYNYLIHYLQTGNTTLWEGLTFHIHLDVQPADNRVPALHQSWLLPQ